jgi:hypothetical protein
MRHRALAALVVLAAAALSLIASRAQATDLTFAGSAQLDWLFVPSTPANDATRGQYTLDGFTLEASEKLSADVSNRVSANVKVCFGCHGFELDMGYVDFRIADELNFRAGRFSPSFGSFNLRHDVGNHKLSDKPLPYDMGRMLRLRSWNLGVLPSPFPDTGLEVDGTRWFGNSVQLDYAVYAVTGFRSVDTHPLDIDFRRSHAYAESYYFDNNAFPTVGARVALTVKLGERSDMTVGASGMYGKYDPGGTLAYELWGGDFSLRVARTFVRAEYLARRTQMDTNDPTLFARPLAPGDDSFIKHGWYVEVEQPLWRDVDLIGRADSMYRIGNFPREAIAGAPGQEAVLSRHSSIYRYTLGTSWAIEPGLRLKLSGELWQFSDPNDDGRSREIGMHVALVGTF